MNANCFRPNGDRVAKNFSARKFVIVRVPKVPSLIKAANEKSIVEENKIYFILF